MSRILRLIYVIFVVVQGCERLLVWVARFGFLIYPLYGIVSWFMTSRKERVRKRAALAEALFSVLAASSVSLLIRCIWHSPRPFTRGRTARITHGDNASFPSNHTLNAVAGKAEVPVFCGGPCCKDCPESSRVYTTRVILSAVPYWLPVAPHGYIHPKDCENYPDSWLIFARKLKIY